MPRKVRELEADLRRAGFVRKVGKGSHRIYNHPYGVKVVISGAEGADAKHYQEIQVAQALAQVSGGR